MKRWILFAVFVMAVVLPGGASARAVQLFADGRARTVGLRLTPDAAEALKSEARGLVLQGVPLLSGETADFHLERTTVFADDAGAVSQWDGGTTSAIVLDESIKSWSGTDPQSSRSLYLSIDADNQLHALIAGEADDSPTVIAPEAPGSYRLLESEMPLVDFCRTDNLPAVPGAEAPVVRAVAPSDTLYEAELTIDIGFKLRTRLSNNGVTPQRYVEDLLGAVNTIYRRDLGAVLKITNLVVWEIFDPFNDNLETYRLYVKNNRGPGSFDLCHLLDSNGTGGVAYVDVLRYINDYRVGISSVDGTGQFPSNISTYYWDTFVTAHELGHNFGSSHTHCYDPPIDCCAVECSGCSTAAPALGTIMSYCHLQTNRGGGIALQFHNRVVSLLRGRIVDSPLLTALPKRPDLVVYGQDEAEIPAGDLTPGVGDGTMFPTQTASAPTVSRAFTIRNAGNAVLTLGNPPVSITGSSEFTVSGGHLPSHLSPGGTAAFNVSFTPANNGSFAAQLSIRSDDPDTPIYSFQVSARVAEPAPPRVFSHIIATSIPDNSTFGTWVDINVSGLTGHLMDLQFHINGTNCSNPTLTGIQHPRVSDLHLTLESPQGTVITVLNRPGQFAGAGAHFCQTHFADNPAFPPISAITPASAPYTGNYRPDQPFATFRGENPNGRWRGRCYDSAASETGVL